MIGKHLVNIWTKRAVKRNKVQRISNEYSAARSIGIIYSQCDGKHQEMIAGFIDHFVHDGKKVSTLIYFPNLQKDEMYTIPHFSERDLALSGNWKRKEVEDFKTIPFDYLISLDWEVNKYTKNILAISSAKCRVGRYEADASQFYELMINHTDTNYREFLGQLYQYIKRVKNG